MTPVEFGVALQGLRPSAVDFQVLVDELIDGVDSSDHHALVNLVFDFFERYPSEYLGSPGGLVHFVERFYPEYKARLLFSLRKAPSLSAVWMANRILNSGLGSQERTEYLAALRTVHGDVRADVEVRSSAQHFLDHQAGRI